MTRKQKKVLFTRSNTFDKTVTQKQYKEVSLEKKSDLLVTKYKLAGNMADIQNII